MSAVLKLYSILIITLFISVHAYAASKIIIITKDNDGWASGIVYLHKEKLWMEDGTEKRKFESFSNLRLNDGTATFSVTPGKYRVNVYYNETVGPDISQQSEEFLVADHEEVSREFYFGKGIINVVGKDKDGWASGIVYLHKEKLWMEDVTEKRKFESFSNLQLSDGTATFSVPPGNYRVNVYYNETVGPDISKKSEEFLVADHEEVSREFYFEKGTINVVRKDSDDSASGRAYLYKEKIWMDAGIEKRKFEPFSNLRLSNGAATFSVPPGKYRVTVYYSETTGPDLSEISEEFLVADKEEVSIEF